MSDVAADVAAFLAADTTDVLAADTTDVLSAAKAASGGFCPANNPCASGVAQFLFFPEKCTSWKKVTCRLGIFGRFLVDSDPKMTQNVPGPHFSR